MRVAIYFTPPRDHPLTRAASIWLGRDAFTGEELSTNTGMRAITAEARRYGFHATMKAPFRLAQGRSQEELDRALANFCRRGVGTEIPVLGLARLGRFFALVSEGPSEGVDALAANVVRAFEPFRAPLTEAEMVQRRSASLSPAQTDHLAHWGYPYVFGEFRFHMTLTGPVPPREHEAVEAALRARFDAFIGMSLAVDGLALFIQSAADEAFVVRALHPVGRDRLHAS